MISHSIARSLQQRRRGILTAAVFIGDIISGISFRRPGTCSGKLIISLAWHPQDQQNEEQDKKLMGRNGFMG
jgi:hypothetical protein